MPWPWWQRQLSLLYCLGMSCFICTCSRLCSAVYFFGVESLLPQALAGSVALSPRPGSLGSRRVCALPESRLWTRLSLWRGVLSPHPLALVEGQPDVGSRVPTLTSVRARGPCLSRLCQQPDLGVSIPYVASTPRASSQALWVWAVDLSCWQSGVGGW